ncbi:MAG: outer membrane beta-barrel protein [Pseudomonadota bacterium]
MRPCTALILILCLVGGVRADTGDVTLLAGPIAGGSFDDLESGAELDIDAAAGFGIAAHINAPAGGQYEFLYLRQATDIGTSALFSPADEVDLDIEYFQVGGNYPLGEQQAWQPYVVLTVGAARYSPDAPDTESEVFAAMTGGLGLYHELGERFALRLEARALATWIDEETSVFCVSAGGAVCAINVEGDTVVQWSAMAALTWRF